MGMRRRREKALTPATLSKLPTGMHCDGGGLYLTVSESGARSWIIRTRIRDKRCDVGLGGLSYVSLAEARDEAVKLRVRAKKGEDIVAGLVSPADIPRSASGAFRGTKLLPFSVNYFYRQHR